MKTIRLSVDVDVYWVNDEAEAYRRAIEHLAAALREYDNAAARASGNQSVSFNLALSKGEGK